MRLAATSVLARGMGLAVIAAAAYPTAVSPHAATSNTVVFDREIVRILDEHCVMCHSRGGPSFPLETYEQTWLERRAIHDAVLARHMPPWAAVPGYGEFVNDNRLTLREKRFIVSWVEGLGPRNDGVVFRNVLDPAAAPPEIRARHERGTWRLGEPDLTLALPAPSELREAAPLRVARTVVDTGLTEARGLAALEYRPAERSTLHAAVFSLEASGRWLATWTPWHGFRRLPEGAALELEPGARIVAEMYLDPAAEAPADAGALGLQLDAAAGAVRAGDVVLRAAAALPSGARAQRLHAEARIGAPIEALALWPALPAGVESIELTARHLDGRVEVLLLALDVPLEWPTPYVYETPVALPAGTVLSLAARVSNPAAAPARIELSLTLSASLRASVAASLP